MLRLLRAVHSGTEEIIEKKRQKSRTFADKVARCLDLCQLKPLGCSRIPEVSPRLVTRPAFYKRWVYLSEQFSDRGDVEGRNMRPAFHSTLCCIWSPGGIIRVIDLTRWRFSANAPMCHVTSIGIGSGQGR